MINNKKSRKRRRCIRCKKRVNLDYEIKDGFIYMCCKNCGCHGKWKDKYTTKK